MRIDGTPEASLRNVATLRDDMSPVVIVGAGWAGLSAALHLRRAGVPVQVLEAAPQAGGRARSQTLPWPDTDGIVLDNGQHLLLGAYREAFDLLPDVDRARQRPGLIMAAIYASLLDEIARSGYPVMTQRIALTPLRKFWLACRTRATGRPPRITTDPA